jgi:kinesin family protein 18/19
VLQVQAQSAEEIMELLQRGNRNRTQHPTAANEVSSRSHAVLQVRM